MLRRGFALEYVTLGWNVAGIVVLAIAAIGARSVALGWWWADPAAGYVLVYYAAREVREIFSGQRRDDLGVCAGAGSER